MDVNSIKTCKQVMLVILVLAVVVAIAGLFKVSNVSSWLIGVALGTALSEAKMVMLRNTLEKAVDMDSERATTYVRANYTLRLMLSVVLVVVAAIVSFINVFGVLVGLLLVQPAAYITRLIFKPKDGVIDSKQ